MTPEATKPEKHSYYRTPETARVFHSNFMTQLDKLKDVRRTVEEILAKSDIDPNSADSVDSPLHLVKQQMSAVLWEQLLKHLTPNDWKYLATLPLLLSVAERWKGNESFDNYRKLTGSMCLACGN